MSYIHIPNRWCDGILRDTRIFFPRAAVAVICLPKSAEDDQEL